MYVDTIAIYFRVKDGGYYIGSTENLRKRLNEHNRGKTRSLRHRRPLGIIHFEVFDTREEAETREKQIKSWKGGDAFKVLIQQHI